MDDGANFDEYITYISSCHGRKMFELPDSNSKSITQTTYQANIVTNIRRIINQSRTTDENHTNNFINPKTNLQEQTISRL